MHTILGHFDFNIDFWPHSRFFVSGAYLLYITANFPQMCPMLDQFLWGHHVTVTFLVQIIPLVT